MGLAVYHMFISYNFKIDIQQRWMSPAFKGFKTNMKIKWSSKTSYKQIKVI